jgi:hypothetical protein
MAVILEQLAEGDMRTTGRSEEVAKDVLANTELFGDVFEGLTSDNPGVRMRSADALEKITGKKPELLQPYKKEFIAVAQKAEQQEVQWHIAQMFPRLELSEHEKSTAVEILEHFYHNSQSNIVKVMSMQAIFDLLCSTAKNDDELLRFLTTASDNGAPSVRSRAQKLLGKIEQ